MALIPLISGSRRSMSVIAGGCFLNCSRADLAVPAVPTNSRSSSFATTVAIPSRKRGWSSTQRIRIRTEGLTACYLGNRASRSNTSARGERVAQRLRQPAQASQPQFPLLRRFLLLVQPRSSLRAHAVPTTRKIPPPPLFRTPGRFPRRHRRPAGGRDLDRTPAPAP